MKYFHDGGKYGFKVEIVYLVLKYLQFSRDFSAKWMIYLAQWQQLIVCLFFLVPVEHKTIFKQYMFKSEEKSIQALLSLAQGQKYVATGGKQTS